MNLKLNITMLAFALIVFTSCSKDSISDNSNIYGTWQVTGYTLVYNNIFGEKETVTESYKDGDRYTFYHSGSGRRESNNDSAIADVVEFFWELNGQTLALAPTDPYYMWSTYEVTLNGNSMVMKQIFPGVDRDLQYYLVRRKTGLI